MPFQASPTKPRNFRSSKPSSLENKLEQLIQQSQFGNQMLGEGAVPTKATGGSITFESPQGQDFAVREHIRKKAADDSLKIRSVLPILDDLEQSYMRSYGITVDQAGNPIFGKNQSGVQGGLGALGAFGQGILMRGNPELRNLVGKLKQYRPAIIRAAGDVGNFSQTEQQAAGESLPQLGPNLNMNNLFLPDDPQQGYMRIKALKDMYRKKYEEQVYVSETGDLTPGYQNYFSQSGGAAQVQPPQDQNPRELLKQRIKAKYGSVR